MINILIKNYCNNSQNNNNNFNFNVTFTTEDQFRRSSGYNNSNFSIGGKKYSNFSYNKNNSKKKKFSSNFNDCNKNKIEEKNSKSKTNSQFESKSLHLKRNNSFHNMQNNISNNYPIGYHNDKDIFRNESNYIYFSNNFNNCIKKNSKSCKKMLNNRNVIQNYNLFNPNKVINNPLNNKILNLHTTQQQDIKKIPLYKKNTKNFASNNNIKLKMNIHKNISNENKNFSKNHLPGIKENLDKKNTSLRKISKSKTIKNNENQKKSFYKYVKNAIGDVEGINKVNIVKCENKNSKIPIKKTNLSDIKKAFVPSISSNNKMIKK